MVWTSIFRKRLWALWLASAIQVVSALFILRSRDRNVIFEKQSTKKQWSTNMLFVTWWKRQARCYTDRMLLLRQATYSRWKTSILEHLQTHIVSLSALMAWCAECMLTITGTSDLPWALRGIIEDQQVRALFSEELQTLRDQFEVWQPKTKALQQVQAALEPLRLIPRSAKSDSDFESSVSKTDKKATAKL